MDVLPIILYYPDLKDFKKTEKEHVIDLLFRDKAIVPTTYIINKLKNNEINTTEFSQKELIKLLSPSYINNEKIEISNIDDKIPLYDIQNKDIYLINKNNVYNRIINYHYRFPNVLLFNDLKITYKKITQNKKYQNNPNITFYAQKLKKNITFLSNFDLNELEKRYINVVYKDTKEIGKELTLCKRPSYLSYITTSNPYYSRSELINMGLNMNLRKADMTTYYDETKLTPLCEEVSQNDITASTLLNHQKYIEENNGKNLVTYFTLYGSYYMNKYLRNTNNDQYRNELLEKLINNFNKLISNTPALEKSYYVYRFINDDSYLQNLKIGDTFQDNGFTSVTRDPFYDTDLSIFGLVLLKIKLPENIKGSVLCAETYSMFQKEQELILPINTKMILKSIDNVYTYYHTDERHRGRIKKKYEFEIVSKNNSEDKIIKFENYPKPTDIKHIDFIDFKFPEEIQKNTIEEKIKYFIANYTNEILQFETNIGNKTYLFNCQVYDSTYIYKKFFYFNTTHGLWLYYIDPITNEMLITIEVGNAISINYIGKYTNSNLRTLPEKDFIIFISKIAYAFNIDKIFIHADFASCTTISKSIKLKILDYSGIDTYNAYLSAKDLFNYCYDFYDYFKNNKKRYETIGKSIQPDFYHYQLDKLDKTNPDAILNETDDDDLFHIYKNIFLNSANMNNTLRDFYIFIIENFFYKLDILEKKMSKKFQDDNNPFIHKYYILEPLKYLYENKLISSLPIATNEIIDGYINYDIVRSRSQQYSTARKVQNDYNRFR